MMAGMALRDWLGFPSTLAQENAQLSQEVVQVRATAQEHVREGMMVALSLALEDRNWIRVDGFNRDRAGVHLTFEAIQGAAKNARALVQANPLMDSAISSKMSVVWGEGVRITGADTYIDRASNRRTLFSEEARQSLQKSKSADGNVFIVVSGLNTSIIPFYEIDGAVYNPSDASEILYFLRKWTEEFVDYNTKAKTTVERKMFYPNMTYDRGGLPFPESMYGIPVYQDGVVKHARANVLSGGAWGVPDILSGIFYATEHKELIEAADSIFRAQSQYAIQYKSKTQKGLANVAAMIAGPMPLDPQTGEPMQYGASAAFGSDIEMQLMNKIGGGIDFEHFDAIAALAASGTGIPLKVVLGKEDMGESSLPFVMVQKMKMEQRFWDDIIRDILIYMGATKKKLKTFWPKINPDPTHRQVQSIVGAAKTKTISPQQTFELFRDTFGADWEDEMPDPSLWDDFGESKLAPGAVEGPGAPVTPGQGQTGELGKLADGDHELRDEGLQDHTRK